MSVVVVGGGIAGLAAAHRLHHAGVAVTLVEATDRVGGKLRTSPFAGRLVDEGADAFLLRVPWALDLCRAVGIEAELVHPAERTAYLWGRGALRPMPPNLLGVPTDLTALAASGVISDAGLARAALDPGPAPTGPDDDPTIGAVLGGRLGDEVLDRMVDPLIGGINAGDVRTLSLASVAPQLAAAAADVEHPSLVDACRAQQTGGFLKDGPGAGRQPRPSDPPPPVFASPRDGMERLAAAVLADAPGIELRTGAAVSAVLPSGGGWAVALADGTILEADAVVLALPPVVLAGLLADVAAEAAGHLAGIDAASVAIVTLALALDDLGRPLDRSGYLVPRVEGGAITACSWSSTKWEHLAPADGDGTALVRASVGRAGDRAAYDLDDDALVAAVVDDLGRTMALGGAPTATRVSRWPDGLPQYRPGHEARVAAALAALPAGLAVAGAAFRGVGVPACTRSGAEAAERTLVHLGAGAPR